MKRNALSVLAMLSLFVAVSGALAQDTAFTYQGRLSASGNVVTGIYDLKFTLFNSNSGGSVIAGPVTNSSVGITGGLFAVTLDFSNAAFTGPNRWLEIQARTNGAGSFTLLNPRQQVTPSPYAIAAGTLTGVLPGGALNGAYSNAVALTNGANNFDGDGSGLTALNASNLGSGTVPDTRLSNNIARTNQVWLLDGNLGTAPGAQFLGTRDYQPLELKVNSARALRLEPATNSPNLIGGYGGNSVSAGVRGAAIVAGGDPTTGANSVAANFSSIGGGFQNAIQSGATESIIAGGVANSIQLNALRSTIGGGENKQDSEGRASLNHRRRPVQRDSEQRGSGDDCRRLFWHRRH
jgi:hypothetical protein